MSKIRLFGTSSGYVEIAPAAAASNNTLTAPSTVGEIIAKDAAGAIGVTSVHTTNITATGIATITTAKIGAGVTISESGIDASGVGVTCANLNRSQIGGRRNIVINGAMQVAQRATTSTTSGYSTVDRFQNIHVNTDEAPTQERASVSSSDTPYRLGFTKSYKITNGNQTGGAAANSTCLVDYRIESRDLRHCSWNFKDSTENIVLSYWVKASVAQTYYVRVYTGDNPSQAYTFGYALSANTWTKIVHKIPGHSNIVFDDDNGIGMIIRWYQYRGTDYTDNSVTLNEWRSHNSSQNTPDQTTTWYTTNDATWEITGVQLEAGDEATPFEHRSYAEEIQLCMRYCQKIFNAQLIGTMNTSTRMRIMANFTVPMRGTPSYTRTSNNLSFQIAASNENSSNTTEAQGGATATAEGNSYARTWDFGGFSTLSDRSFIGGNGGHVFTLDGEL